MPSTIPLNRLTRMTASNCARFLLLLVVFALAPVSEVMATQDDHSPGSGREQPWTNCTTCHGPDLLGVGGITPSCMSCHNDFASPDPPSQGHHNPTGEWQHILTEPRKDPFTNGCTACHGSDLLGGAAPSCFTCHGELWGGGSGNSPPSVDTGGPYFGAPGVPVAMDASGTTDPDADPLFYVWSFGDGTPSQFPSQDPQASHTYQNVGTYTVVLLVTDQVNDPVPAETTVTIADNLPPTADPGGPYSGAVGQSIQFDGSGSSDPDGDTLTHEWDFGDGGTSSSPTPAYTYQGAGTYTAVLTVDDGVNDPVSAQVNVEIIVQDNLPPEVDPGGPYAGAVGQEVQFDASGTSDPDGDSLTYIWDFGDGTLPSFPSTSPAATHAYDAVGTYTGSVTAWDGVNDPVTVEVEVMISDDGLPPPSGEDGDWHVLLPFLLDEFTVRFEEFSSILLVDITQSDGQASYGIGMEFSGLVFWMDVTGALYMGSIDHNAGTMMGLVFGHPGGSSVWFGERSGQGPGAGTPDDWPNGWGGFGTVDRRPHHDRGRERPSTRGSPRSSHRGKSHRRPH